MNPLEEQISRTELRDRFFTERQLKERVPGSDARRYGLVNRALKDGSLFKVKRGVYLLASEFKNHSIHKYAATQVLVPGSYISFETALSFHGWIPEAVYTVASVSPGRKTLRFDAGPVGEFTFHPLAVNDYQFLTSVERRKIGRPTIFVAHPLRALMDLVALRKESWAGLEWLTVGMRIEEHALLGLRRKDFVALKPVYKHASANAFLISLEQSVMALKSERKGSTAND